MGFPDSFVGFFNFVSDVLRDTGNEWFVYGEEEQDDSSKKWGKAFIEAADETKKIANSLDNLRNDFEKQALVEETPANLINKFKNKVAKEIKAL